VREDDTIQDAVGDDPTATETEMDETETGQVQTDETPPEALSEAEVLRSDLGQAQLEAADFKNRFLRARADLENYRRRASQDTLRARESGLDSAILPLLAVYDDLGRALTVSSDDPAQLIPGIQAVRESLKRNLGALGLEEVGTKGDAFDPDLHEALTTVPAGGESAADTIAEVVQTGFVKAERLVRPARVVVFQ